MSTASMTVRRLNYSQWNSPLASLKSRTLDDVERKKTKTAHVHSRKDKQQFGVFLQYSSADMGLHSALSNKGFLLLTEAFALLGHPLAPVQGDSHVNSLQMRQHYAAPSFLIRQSKVDYRNRLRHSMTDECSLVFRAR